MQKILTRLRERRTTAVSSVARRALLHLVSANSASDRMCPNPMSARLQRIFRAVQPDAAVALALLGVVALLLGTREAGAQPLPGWHHTSWSRTAAPPVGGGHSLAQSPDGYLWLGASSGLVRFDGVRFEFFDGAGVPALRSDRNGVFRPQIVDREGNLWIARPDGALLTYRDGVFRVVLAPDASVGSTITEDGAGRLWLFGSDSAWVHMLRAGRPVRVRFPAPAPDSGVIAVVSDTADGVWVGTRTQGLWHVDGRGARRQPSHVNRAPDEVRPLLQDRNGTLWSIGIGLDTGLHTLVEGRWTRVVPPLFGEGLVRGRNAVQDANGAVWIASHGSGVLRWWNGRLEQFTEEHGLSDANVRAVFVDEEGSVWAVTDAGVDRLRRADFVTLARRDGLPFDTPTRLAQDSSGVIWATGAPDHGIYRLGGGLIDGNSDPIGAVPLDLPTGDSYDLLGAARGGGIWIGPHRGGVLRFRNNRIEPFGISGTFPGERVSQVVEAPDGTLWIALERRGFGRVRDGRYEAVRLPGLESATVLGISRDDEGRLWVSAAGARSVYVLDADSVIARFGSADGVGDDVLDVVHEDGGVVWGVTGRSLLRFADGSVAVVLAQELERFFAASPRLLISGTHLWIASEAGIARIPLPRLHAVADGAPHALEPRFFDALDGLSTPASTTMNVSPLLLTSDGRIWISTPDGISVLDPAWTTINRVPPLVHVEDVTGAGQVEPAARGMEIPPNPARLAIRFTATGLRMPERVRIEYRLDNVDPAWVQSGWPRVADYTQLRPGQYVFRVRAWNEDGVPSPGESVWSFRVLPAWYQTWWFMGLGLLAVAATGSGAAVLAQRARGRRAATRAQARFDAMLTERTRIARELHDTLLQGFTGITLQLEALRQQTAQTASSASESLARILAIADTTLREAREMVWDMRAPELQASELPEVLELACRTALDESTTSVRFRVAGVPRRLAPVVETAALRVGREAAVNVAKHAGATEADLELAYEPSGIRLTIRDNGRGILASELESAPKTGHWGIAGMRERARIAGGSLLISRLPSGGTRVVLSLPSDPLP